MWIYYDDIVMWYFVDRYLKDRNISVKYTSGDFTLEYIISFSLGKFHVHNAITSQYISVF